MAKKKAKSYPWQLRSGEPDNAFAAFRRYRDMTTTTGPLAGQRRTTPKLHDLMEGEPKRVGRNTLAEWCKDWDWRARAAAYDRHLDQMRLDTNEKMMRDMQRRHVRLAMQMQDVAGTELGKMGKRARNAVKELKDVNTGDIARFAEQGVKIERLARGQATERVEGKLDLSQLSLAELRTLKLLRDKAKADG